jgi:hypothetical protein
MTRAAVLRRRGWWLPYSDLGFGIWDLGFVPPRFLNSDA